MRPSPEREVERQTERSRVLAAYLRMEESWAPPDMVEPEPPAEFKPLQVDFRREPPRRVRCRER